MDVDELKARKLEELQAQATQERFEQVKKVALQHILTKAARERLARIKLVNPQLVEQLEAEILQAVNAGQLKQVTDETLKAILANVYSSKKEFRFVR